MKVRIGIDLGGSFIKAGAVTPDLKIVHKLIKPCNAASGPAAVKRNLVAIWHKISEHCLTNGFVPQSLGIGSPGTIAQPTGIVTDASPNIKGWSGVCLTKIFGKIDIPVYADNDANCAALAEYICGLGRRYHDIIFMTIGTGIGGGLILDGRLIRGSSFSAGEIGHTVLRLNGRRCKCGRKGCLEAYASVPNMIDEAKADFRRLKLRPPETLTAESLFAAFKQGNRAAAMTIRRNVDYIGNGLASIVNLLNPQAVIIGGGFSHAGGEYIEMIADVIKKRAFFAAARNLKVMRARLGNDAGFIGASLLYRVQQDGSINVLKKR